MASMHVACAKVAQLIGFVRYGRNLNSGTCQCVSLNEKLN